MLLLVIFAFVRGETGSCFHSTACYDSTNEAGYALCTSTGGEISGFSCCNGFCKMHQGFAGCSSCEYECPLTSIYCPITIGDDLRPDCDTNACVDSHCTYGGQSCGEDSPCPCVCGSGHSETTCTAVPDTPPKPCNHALKCNHLYNSNQQQCVRDVCIKAPSAYRGHSLWDSSSICTSNSDTPCICEFTGQKCEYGTATPPPSVPCDGTCKYNPSDTCITSACIRQFPHQHYGHCQYDSYEQCVNDADCSCVCKESHKPCEAPPVLCPNFQCNNIEAGTTCHFQHCKIPVGRHHGACTLCGSPCASDNDCPCVCNGDHKTRCVAITPPPTPAPTQPVCCERRPFGGSLSCEVLSPEQCAMVDGSTNLVYCTSTCQPIQTCCYLGFDCVTTSTFTCNNEGTFAINGKCDGQCEPEIGCCMRNTSPMTCDSGIAYGDCDSASEGLFTFSTGSCCPANPECGCETTTPFVPTTTTPSPTTSTPMINTPCCWQIAFAGDDETLLCLPFDNQCEAFWTPNTGDDVACDEFCNPILGCCEFGGPSGVECVPDTPVGICRREDSGGTTSLTYCNSTCLPVETCCYINGQCTTTSLFDCQLRGTPNPPPSLCAATTCEQVGCCLFNAPIESPFCGDMAPSQCAEVGGQFVSGPCCPANSQCECVETTTPAPTSNPCVGDCPATWLGLALVSPGSKCSSQPEQGVCVVDGNCLGWVYDAQTRQWEMQQCSTTSACGAFTCTCDAVCGCLYESEHILKCSDIPLITTTSTPMPTTTHQSCGGPCPAKYFQDDLGEPLTSENEFCTNQIPIDGQPGTENSGICLTVEVGPHIGQQRCSFIDPNNYAISCSGPCDTEGAVCICEERCLCKYSNPSEPGFGFVYVDCNLEVATTSSPTTSTHVTAPTTTPFPTTTGTPATTTFVPTPTPCVPIESTACGVRPGCKGGTRNNKECNTLSDCPGATACVPLKNACQITEPCFACEPFGPVDAMRSCRVCMYCTADEIAEQEENPDQVFAFKCCPVDLQGGVNGPIPPQDKCDKSQGSPSDCAREFDCACHVDSCVDKHDTLEGYFPTTKQMCDNGLDVMQEDQILSATSQCVLDVDLLASDHDYYTVNVTTHKKVVVYINNLLSHVKITQLDCPGTLDVAVFVDPDTTEIDGDYLKHEFTVAEFGLYAIRIFISCESDTNYHCSPYKVFFKTQPVNCPLELCDLKACISAIDCDTAGSCFGCDNLYGRCIERSNCTRTECCDNGEPSDTCVDASDGVACRVCSNDDCRLGACASGLCVTSQQSLKFDCDCRCRRMCWKDEDCDVLDGYTRDCDTHNGACVYRVITPSPTAVLSSLRGQRASLANEECVRSALDASEKGYAAYAMDRFGGFTSTGERRPGLCGGSVEWQNVHIDTESVPTLFQTDCCIATRDVWQSECFHGETTRTNETGHTWADRAWYMMHQARLMGQNGHAAHSVAKSCCASLIWSALGQACGRTSDVWSIDDGYVATNTIGPVAKWIEDGASDDDKNDAVLFVSQSTVYRRDDTIASVNTHTYLLARGGGYEASVGIVYGTHGAFATHKTDETIVCPERERRLNRAALDQSSVMKQIAELEQPPTGSIVAIIRHVVAASDNKMPTGISDAECITVSGVGTTLCPATQFAALYPTTESALPLRSHYDSLESSVKYRAPVVNTQSGMRFQAPEYAASSAYIPSRKVKRFTSPFVLRNHDCGVTILDGDKATVAAPFIVTIPADAAQHTPWLTEGTPLFVRIDSNERYCRSGPLSGVEQCTNDAVCDGGYCAAPVAKTGAAYVFALEHFECAARGVDCTNDASSRCCLPQVQQWYRYGERTKELLYEPQNK